MRPKDANADLSPEKVNDIKNAILATVGKGPAKEPQANPLSCRGRGPPSHAGSDRGWLHLSSDAHRGRWAHLLFPLIHFTTTPRSPQVVDKTEPLAFLQSAVQADTAVEVLSFEPPGARPGFVITFQTVDRPGVLARISAALHDLGLEILGAEIKTKGGFVSNKFQTGRAPGKTRQQLEARAPPAAAAADTSPCTSAAAAAHAARPFSVSQDAIKEKMKAI